MKNIRKFNLFLELVLTHGELNNEAHMYKNRQNKKKIALVFTIRVIRPRLTIFFFQWGGRLYLVQRQVHK